MAEVILKKKKKEIKLSPSEHEFILWNLNKINSHKRTAAIFSKHFSDYLNEVLRKHNEIPGDHWDFDPQKGVIFEKGVPIIGSNSNGNKPK